MQTPNVWMEDPTMSILNHVLLSHVKTWRLSIVNLRFFFIGWVKYLISNSQIRPKEAQLWQSLATRSGISMWFCCSIGKKEERRGGYDIEGGMEKVHNLSLSNGKDCLDELKVVLLVGDEPPLTMIHLKLRYCRRWSRGRQIMVVLWGRGIGMLDIEDEIIMVTLDVMVVMTLDSKSWWWWREETI